MEHALPLAGWENFYVIVGSSAAALTGLQFVVITLIGTEQALKSSGAEIGAFGTPTVIHFCSALGVACMVSAPWRDVSNASTALSIVGGLGALYCAIVIRRARQPMSYKPVLEDWIFHSILPFITYVVVVVAARQVPRHRDAQFVIAGASLVLLLIGIRNAWDSVTYLAIDRRKQQERP
ncbi:MAG: hypothetical protein ABR567_08890 [Myxococcales bacterium]